MRFAVGENRDIRFAELTSKDSVSFGHTLDIVHDHHRFLWFDTSSVLNRYEGYQFHPHGRDPAHPDYTTRFTINANGRNGVLGPIRHVRQDWAGILWLSSEDGLHRLDSATRTFLHYSHYWADPASLSRWVVRSTYEDRQRTFVAWTTRVSLAGLGSD